MHQMAQIYNCRPSSYIGLPPTSLEAFNFDFACARYGAIEDQKDKTKDTQEAKPESNYTGPPLDLTPSKIIDDPNFNGIW